MTNNFFKAVQKKERGFYDSYSDSNVVLVQWNDNRVGYIGLLRNAVRPETARALKSSQRIANQNIGQHQPVDCVKQGRYVSCKKNTTKECYKCKVGLHVTCFLPYHVTDLE